MTRAVRPSAAGGGQWELVKQGMGIGLMLEDVGDAEARVVPVLPDLVSFAVPVWLTSHHALSTSWRMRVVFDVLAKGLGHV